MHFVRRSLSNSLKVGRWNQHLLRIHAICLPGSTYSSASCRLPNSALLSQPTLRSRPSAISPSSATDDLYNRSIVMPAERNQIVDWPIPEGGDRLCMESTRMTHSQARHKSELNPRGAHACRVLDPSGLQACRLEHRSIRRSHSQGYVCFVLPKPAPELRADGKVGNCWDPRCRRQPAFSASHQQLTALKRADQD